MDVRDDCLKVSLPNKKGCKTTATIAQDLSKSGLWVGDETICGNFKNARIQCLSEVLEMIANKVA